MMPKSIIHDGCFAPVSIRGRAGARFSPVFCVEEFPTYYRVWFRQSITPRTQDISRQAFLDMVQQEQA